MSRPGAEDRIHSLEIPLHEIALLVPSAAIAEVANPTELYPVPGSPPWVLGVMGWRTQPVPVISFEGLLGRTAPPAAEGSKIVIFYPLSGPRDWEFYGILSRSEPRPQQVTSDTIETEDPARLPDSPFVAAGVRVKGRVLFIPDFDALRDAFYP
jgi:chemotaxis signal transduction protein